MQPARLKTFESNPGFTLIEVLLSIFILSIIVSTVFLSYNSLFSRTDDIKNISKQTKAGGNCLFRIIEDLSSIYLPLSPEYSRPKFNDRPNLYRFTGKEVSIGSSSFSIVRFSSHAHLPLKGNGITEKGITRIVYYVEKDDDNGYILKRSDTLYPYAGFEEKESFSEEFTPKKGDSVLCENIKSFSFKYINKQGVEQNEWDSESETYNFSTPYGVRIRLETGINNNYKVFETLVLLPIVRDDIKPEF